MTMTTETLEFIATGEKRQAEITSSEHLEDGYYLTTFTFENGQKIVSRFNLIPGAYEGDINHARFLADNIELQRNGYRIWSDEAQAKSDAEKPVHPDAVERIATALEGIAGSFAMLIGMEKSKNSDEAEG